MNLIKQFLAWLKLNKGYVRFVLTIIVVILIISFYISRGKHIRESTEYKVKSEQLQKDRTDNQKLISILNLGIKNRNKKISTLMIDKARIIIEREDTAKQRDAIKKERDDLQDQIDNMPKSDIYTILMDIWPPKGILEFEFAGNQIGEIYKVTVDYKLVLKDNVALEKDVKDCDLMVLKGDSIQHQLKGNILDLNTTDSLNNELILNLSEEVEIGQDEVKRLKRKLFWTYVGAGIIIVGETVVFISN